MKLRIENKVGVGAATKVFNAETGEEISTRRLRRVEIIIDNKGETMAQLDFGCVAFDITTEAECSFVGLDEIVTETAGEIVHLRQKGRFNKANVQKMLRSYAEVVIRHARAGVVR